MNVDSRDYDIARMPRLFLVPDAADYQSAYDVPSRAFPSLFE